MVIDIQVKVTMRENCKWPGLVSGACTVRLDLSVLHERLLENIAFYPVKVGTINLIFWLQK